MLQQFTIAIRLAAVVATASVFTLAGVARAQTPPTVEIADRAPTSYTVQKGDTLYSLARRYGTTVSAIMAANGLTDADRIRSGQSLRMPGTR